MESDSLAKIILRPLRAKTPATGKTPLNINYGVLKDYVEHAALDYEEKRQAFESTTIDDPDFLRITKKWQRSARALVSWVESWFTAYYDNKDEQQAAINFMDRITKDAGIREKNMWAYVKKQKEILKEKDQLTDAAEDRLDREEASADHFTRSAMKTQNWYTDRLNKGGEAVNVEMELEKKAGKQIERTLDKIPEGRLFSQAIIFPPHRIPVNMPVPSIPDAYDRVQWMDPEDLELDPGSGELVPRKGYISEDKLIDDHSVIYHTENKTVDIGYRGGERVIWKYEKLENPSDNFDPDSWCIEYTRRLYFQELEEARQGWFRRRPYEDDQPYNRKPDNSG